MISMLNRVERGIGPIQATVPEILMGVSMHLSNFNSEVLLWAGPAPWGSRQRPIIQVESLNVRVSRWGVASAFAIWTMLRRASPS